ncbi:MAG: NAD(P)H-dependent oxidoreductase [Acidobacteria bacterium]|nr:NAD(P)H-dependent oxidoreductase [Acidobacteriota bacterium]
MTNTHKVRIVAISGSLRAKSFSRMAVLTALEGARQLGAETEYLDLRDVRVACDGNEEDRGYPDSVYTLREAVKSAHGVLLCTPEYHGSVSGVLKNALDLMGFREFSGKIIGLLGVSAGALGGIDALNTLRSVGRALHAWVAPQQAAIPFCGRAFDENGQIIDPKMRERVLDVGRQVVRFAYLHHSPQAQDFLRAWEEAAPNPGGNQDTVPGR